MNKKIKNLNSLNIKSHFQFFTYFKLILLLSILFFVFSIWEAREDLKSISQKIKDSPQIEESENMLKFHSVKKGETISSLSQELAISADSIKWSNEDIVKTDITPGMIVKIPPGNGILHLVKKNESTKDIAQKYKSTEFLIKNFPNNKFTDSKKNSPTVDELLFVPNGIKSDKDILGRFIKKIFSN